jgi:tetratricopeptide (TPR) repeat protein
MTQQPETPEKTKTKVAHDNGENNMYYLERGFAAREIHDYNTAIDAFQKAVDIDPEDPAVLYILTEMSALLKLQGCYETAINQLERGRKLAVDFKDQAMADEFINGIAYLRILINVLMAERSPCVPFQSLSTEIKNKVDNEFRQWKINSN